MKARLLRILCFTLCLGLACCAVGAAQAPPPPGAQRGGGPGPTMQPGPRRGRARPGRPDIDSRPMHNALQFGPVGRWWDNRSVISNVGISRQQQKQMDAIFDAHRPALVNSYKAFLKAQAKLDALNKSANPDQQKVFAAIDAVNSARSDLQKTASGMLLEIRQHLTPEQIEKLEKLP